MSAPNILAELARVKAIFQLRTLSTIIRGPYAHTQHNQSESKDGSDWLGIGSDNFSFHEGINTDA